MCTATKQLSVILDAKYEKADLHKVMENQFQHLTMTQRNELLKLLQKFEDFFDGTLVTWKKDPVDFELNRMQSQSAREYIQYQSYTNKCLKKRLNV